MFLGMLSIQVIVSCKKKEETPQPTETIIEVNTLVPAVEESVDGNSISAGNDGRDISTKNESNKTNVPVGEGDAPVELKK
jgi:hypothetical protein